MFGPDMFVDDLSEQGDIELGIMIVAETVKF